MHVVGEEQRFHYVLAAHLDALDIVFPCQAGSLGAGLAYDDPSAICNESCQHVVDGFEQTRVLRFSLKEAQHGFRLMVQFEWPEWSIFFMASIFSTANSTSMDPAFSKVSVAFRLSPSLSCSFSIMNIT